MLFLCLTLSLQWTSTRRCPCVSLQPPSPWTYAWTTTSNSSSSRCPRFPRLASNRPAPLERARPVGAWWEPRCANSSYSKSCWPWSRSSRSKGRSSSQSSSGSMSSCPVNMRPSSRNTLRCDIYNFIGFYKCMYAYTHVPIWSNIQFSLNWSNFQTLYLPQKWVADKTCTV